MDRLFIGLALDVSTRNPLMLSKIPLGAVIRRKTSRHDWHYKFGFQFAVCIFIRLTYQSEIVEKCERYIEY